MKSGRLSKVRNEFWKTLFLSTDNTISTESLIKLRNHAKIFDFFLSFLRDSKGTFKSDQQTWNGDGMTTVVQCLTNADRDLFIFESSSMEMKE